MKISRILIAMIVLVLVGWSESGNGQTLTTLWQFSGQADGGMPQAGLVQGSDSNFYGTTWYGGPYDEGVIFSETKTAKDLLGVAFVILQIKGRPQSICPNDSGMVRERQFDQCHKTGEASLPGCHLFAEHSRVAIPKQKYQAATCNPVGT